MRKLKFVLGILIGIIILSCSSSDDNIESSQSNILGTWDLKTIDGEPEYYVDGFGNVGVFQFIFTNDSYILRFIGYNDNEEVEEDIAGTWSVNSSQTELTVSNSVNNSETYEILLLTETDMVLYKTSSEFVFEKAD